MNKDKDKKKRKMTRIVIEEIDDSRLDQAAGGGGLAPTGTSGVPNSNQCQCIDIPDY